MSTDARFKTFPVAYFYETTTVEDLSIIWPARSLAVPPIPPTREAQEAWLHNENLAVFDINEVFTPYNHSEHKNRRILFTHILGGIGDVIAFSSIAEFVRNKTLTVFCNPAYHPIFKWFSNQDVRTKGVNDVIAHEFTPSNRLTKYANFSRLRMEYAAIEAGERNWYDGMFNRIGISATPSGFDRPRLVRRTDSKSKYVKGKDSIIISHRSSCQMRSSRLEDFYFPVRAVYPTATIYVHRADLTPEDINFIGRTEGAINIIPPCSIEQYLDNLYAAALVVCTDTSAIHFREGVAKPCLAAFGAMTTNSRTSGYIHTHSFNVKSKCKFQPCFLHDVTGTTRCPNSKEGDTTAKCQTGKSFQEQLFAELKNYKTR